MNNSVNNSAKKINSEVAANHNCQGLLYQIANVLLKADKIQNVLDKAALAAIESMDAFTVSIALLNEQKDKLVIEIIKRADGKTTPMYVKEFALGEGVTGRTALTRSIISVPDIKNCPYFSHKNKRNEIGSLISAPIISNGELIGVLNVSYSEEKQFSKSEKEFLTILSAIIASAILNSRLLEKTESEKELLNSVIENINEGVLVVDKNKNIIVWNQYLEDITGLSADQVVGKSGIELAKKIGLKNLLSVFIEAVKKRRKDFYLETKFTTAKDELIWVGIAISRILEKGADGNTVVIIRNISKEKELINTKNELITTATHELRTPLTATKGYLSMLRAGDAGVLAKKQGDYVEKAYESTERLVSLVEDLLGALRIDENKVNISKEFFNLNRLVRDAIENLKSKSELKNIEFSFNHKNIISIYADLVKTKHVIENLIDNAIKYTKPHGKVEISITNNDKETTISVSDTGIGIPKQHLESIFDRFVRVPNSLSVKAGGTGLGLYIAKNYVEKQGGKIWIESELHKGSKFIFTLPNK